MWLRIIASIILGVGLKFSLRSTGRIAFFAPMFGYFGCAIIVAGLLMRSSAIQTLGKQFTVQVSIVNDHKIVDTGIYGVVGTLHTLEA